MSSLNAQESADPLATLRIPRRSEARRPSLVSRLFRTALALVLVAGLGGGALYGLSQSGWIRSDAEWIPEAIRSQVEVRTTKVAVETGRAADAVVVGTGYLQSYRQANIGARAAGRIEAVHVEEGTRVEQGEVIAVLDHKDIDAALAAANASLLRAQAELKEQDVEIARTKKEVERNTRLKATNAVSELEYDNADFRHQAAVAKRATLEATVAQAVARVQEGEQFKENMIVRAPFNGTVISKDAEVGESILPGGMGEASGRGSVVTIADLDRLEVDCDVKEDFISRVLPGAPAEVAVDAVPGHRYAAKVRKVIPMGDRARATIKVKVAIQDIDARLFPEMSATVYFLPQAQEQPAETKERRIFCDSGAIVEIGGGSFVWLVDNERRLKKVEVSPGRERDGRTEILHGLSGGERVVVNPPDGLQAGQFVKLRE
jgi:RND family efflux transporter MFP subunit